MGSPVTLLDHGFFRARAVSPVLSLAQPRDNARALTVAAQAAAEAEVALLLSPELSLTGYSCEDLFLTEPLLAECREALGQLLRDTAELPLALVVGAPWPVADGRVFNVALVLSAGQVVGAVPKGALPTYGEFYEQRWFDSGEGVALIIDDPRFGTFPLAQQLGFETLGVRWALELCEDLWSPAPPGVAHALAGAQLILNPSASPEGVGKAAYRRDLVRMASGQRLCGYLYAGAGPFESSKDLVYGGHLLAAEAGSMLGEGERFALDGASLTVDFDVQRLAFDRRRNGSFRRQASSEGYRFLSAPAKPATLAGPLFRRIDPFPFVPGDREEAALRAEDILAIQATGLARRMRAARAQALVIGLSGGLDSTLALLVSLEALKRLGLPKSALCALTLPGPGTSEKTLGLVGALAEVLGLALEHIDIGPAVTQHLAALGHDGVTPDVIFENAQARERTQILFNRANQLGGLVVGTGDLSELALGWCTFNADHMASYNVNGSVPKTLIADLVRAYAAQQHDEALGQALEAVLALPISPELIPGDDPQEVGQLTEAVLGPYEVHDFYLYYALRFGMGPEKLRFLARRAFADRYAPDALDEWLDRFFSRFHAMQFKRTTLPPGPKVGTVSLSPRGDWRMPDETTPSQR